MKRLFLLVPAAAALFAATAAQAGGVSWSVGVNVPPVATVVTSGPAWAPAPVRVVPGAVVYSTPAYAPAPIVYDEPYVTPYPYVVPRVGYWVPRSSSRRAIATGGRTAATGGRSRAVVGIGTTTGATEHGEPA